MNKEQALAFLQQVLGNVPATRQQHEQFLHALKVLAENNVKELPSKE